MMTIANETVDRILNSAIAIQQVAAPTFKEARRASVVRDAFSRAGLHGDGLQFVPNDLRNKLPKPPETIPREKGMDHQQDWLRAIRNPNRPAGCNFDYSVPLATTVLLGNVAARAGLKKLEWDGATITNDESANAFLKTTYRPGWEIKGCSARSG